VSASEESRSPGNADRSGDLQKLREALIAFLNDERADWAALSRDLHALAASPLPPAPSTEATLKSAAPFVDKEQARDAWRQLADHLAHADRAAGVPDEVKVLLESDAAARAAEAAFDSAITHRDKWLEFSHLIRRARHKRDRGRDRK
jgi:hypothetical protein